jgi:hypothetical protein
MTGFKAEANRSGTVSLQRDASLGLAILGLCEMKSTEIRIAPQAHEDKSQQLYTLCHEGKHREIFVGTTFGYLQFLLARVDAQSARGRLLPQELGDAREALFDMLEVSFDAHEGYATMGEYVARESLVALWGKAPDVPEPPPRYQRAMVPYRAVVESLPKLLRPFSHFILRAFVEVVFDTSILVIARSTSLDVPSIRASLKDPLMQPNHRLSLLSRHFVDKLEQRTLGDEWAQAIEVAKRAGSDLPRIIAELRFLMPPLEGVRMRKAVLAGIRETVRKILGSQSASLAIEDGRRSVRAFHNWCFEELKQYDLLGSPMLDSDAEPEEHARLIVENLHVSGQPADMLPIAIGDGVPRELIEETLDDPKKRLAISIRIRGEVTNGGSVTCQSRLIRFAAKTDTWQGPGTQPFQRILVDRPCIDCSMSIAEATDLLDEVRDRIDILYYNTPNLDQAQAALMDKMVDVTKATMVHLVEVYLGADTDKKKVEALMAMASSGKCAFCPFADRDWIAIFFEIAPRTFLGGVVLQYALVQGIGAKLKQWVQECEAEQSRLLEEKDYRVDLGSLSTFTKIFIHGGFREL